MTTTQEHDMSDVDGWQDWRLVANPLVTSGVDGLPERKLSFRHPLESDEQFARSQSWADGWNACRDAYAAQCRAKGAEGECACPEHGSWINAEDVRRHVRTIDVALNGEDGAAKQALLCDIAGQVARVARETGSPILKPAASVVDEGMVDRAKTAARDMTWELHVEGDDVTHTAAERIAVAALTAALSRPATDQDIAEGKALDVAVDEHCGQQAGSHAD